MKLKKGLTIFMSLAMCMGALSGCTGDKDAETAASAAPSAAPEASDSAEADPDAPKEIKPFEVSMLYSDNASYAYSEDWMVWDIIEEHTGAKIKVQAVPESDYEAKRNIIFNTGDMPDIISKTFPKQQDALSGLLLPISDYEDRMPNYKAWIEKYDMRQELDNTRFGDGKYYGLPVKAHTSRLQDQQWLVRTDILEKHDIAIPTTLDELHAAGVKLKELYPDSTPITNRFTTGNIMTGFAAGFGTIAGWTLGNGMYFDYDANEWVFAPTTDNWKNMLEYTRKLVADGVLDSEFATLDSTVYEQRIVQGDTFFMYDWAGNIVRYNQQGKAIDPDYNVTPIYPVKGPEGDAAIAWKASWGQQWVFPATLADDEEQLNNVLSLIDWCYSDEAEVLLTFGKEGETYVKNENGNLQFKDPAVDYCAAHGLDNNSIAVREHSDFLYSSLNAEQVALFEKIAEDKLVPLPNPESPLSVEKMEETQIYQTNIQDHVNAGMEKFIFGQDSLDNWDQFVATCKELGSDNLAKEYNDAWAAKAK